MTTLPITRLIIYKHGVGYFERRGPVSGAQLELNFPREAMDDVLKSLVALDLGPGQVLSVDLATPEDRATRIARGSIHLSDHQSLLDLLRDLRGRQVRLVVDEGKKDALSIEGTLIGVDYEPSEPLRRARASIFLPASQQVRSVPVEDLDRVDLLDTSAAADLSYFLRAAQSDEERRSASLRLSPGDHDLLVGYVAPAPAWRVSYRLLFEEDRPQTTDHRRPHPEPGEGDDRPQTTDDQPSTADQAQAADHRPSTMDDPAAADPSSAVRRPSSVVQESSAVRRPSSSVLIQGWGLFDNQLDEDLANVELTLMAGMPVSFRYRLYEPHTPERPFVQDEERTVDAPIAFAAAAPMAMADSMPLGGARAEAAPMARASRKRISANELETSVQAEATGDERGALFAYHVGHPVSVARGQSAMVPIVNTRLDARRELLYKSQRAPGSNNLRHPVAALRLRNTTGLTLERGPVTVLAAGDYAGEAVLPFTRTGAELIVAYAVELGINVAEQAGHERRIHAVHVKDTYLLIEEYDLRSYVYDLTSTLDQAAVVTVEHPPLANYTFYETPNPAETGSGFARWQVNCPAQARISFKVVEARLVSRQEQVRSLNGAQIQDFLSRGLLDATVAKALDGVLALYRQIDETRLQISQAEQERETIFAHQRQIQGNLQPLGREGEEGALRQRYVATLATFEDQLGVLATRISDLQATIVRLEDQATRRLKRLSREQA